MNPSQGVGDNTFAAILTLFSLALAAVMMMQLRANASRAAWEARWEPLLHGLSRLWAEIEADALAGVLERLLPNPVTPYQIDLLKRFQDQGVDSILAELPDIMAVAEELKEIKDPATGRRIVPGAGLLTASLRSHEQQLHVLSEAQQKPWWRRIVWP